VTGQCTALGPTSDYATVAYDSTGTELWVIRYDGGSSDHPNALAVDLRGNVYVTGYSRVSGSNDDWTTIKYRK